MPRRKDIRQNAESLDAYLKRLDDERHTAQKISLPAVWGDWLTEMGKTWTWDWYCTFTFSDPKVTPDGAHHFVRRYIEKMGNEGVAKPYAFVADEYGTLRGRFHIHALIGNVAHLTNYCGMRLSSGQWGRDCCWMHRWPCGFSRILKYDSSLGAIYYLAKYLKKQMGEWEMIGFDCSNIRFSGIQSHEHFRR